MGLGVGGEQRDISGVVTFHKSVTEDGIHIDRGLFDISALPYENYMNYDDRTKGTILKWAGG